MLCTACIATPPTQDTTGAQVAGTPADIVVLPEPTNTAPALPQPTGIDPYVTLTEPTFPPPPDPDVMTHEAALPLNLPLVTATPLIIDKVVNLAEGLPDGEIYVVIIDRADGTNEQYLLPWSPLGATKSVDEFWALSNQMTGLYSSQLQNRRSYSSRKGSEIVWSTGQSVIPSGKMG